MVSTSRLTVSEQPCIAVFSILAKVLKGLKLPALAESSSIPARAGLCQTTALGIGSSHASLVRLPCSMHGKISVLRPSRTRYKHRYSRDELNVSCQREASSVRTSCTEIVSVVF